MINAYNTDDEASDESEQGPTRSGQDKRANDNDHGHVPEQYVVELPFQKVLCKLCLHTGKGNYMALTLENLISHLKEHKAGIIYKCSRCEKEYKRKHPAQCHMPKCTGLTPHNSNRHMCSKCGEKFKTKSGLSQHQRHRHPAARNEARAAETARGEQAPKDGKAFLKEEIQLMLELEVRFQGSRMIAHKMTDFIPTKTNKQIRDKRNESAYKRMRDEYILRHPQKPEDANPIAEMEVEEEEIRDWLNPPAGREEENLVEQVEVHTTPEDPHSPTGAEIAPELASHEEEWRQWVAETVLADNMPERLTQANRAAPVQLLNESLSEMLQRTGQVPQHEIDNIYKEITKHLLKGEKVKEKKTREVQKLKKDKRKSKKNTKRDYIYARSQKLFKENPGLLAKYVRENVVWHEKSSVCAKPDDIKQLYNELWGEKHKVTLPELGEPEQAIEIKEVLTPITKVEVRKRLARIKLESAAGPDKIKKGQLLHGDTIEILRKFYNLVLINGRLPTSWRENRTTLLRKEGTDPKDAKSYRPITISSILSRLYWGIIDQKIRAKVVQTPRQKGFTAENGCYNNVHILNEVLRHAKIHNGLVVVQLDVSKAFDTVPHEIIGAALRKKGLPKYLVNHIEDSYKDVHTIINCGKEEVAMNLQRGVKQGDPLSPLIFNLTIEPLLQTLENKSGYKINPDINISTLAFADDMLLLANTAEQASELLDTTETYLKGLGMSLSVGKCTTFQIKKTKDSWCLVNPDLKLKSGENIPYADAECKLKYLGMSISPWAGIDIEGLKSNLCSALERVRKLALKPYQKVDLISTYLVPHYLFQLTTAVPNISQIRALDQELRVVIKDIYHLPQSTTNGLIYSGKKDGGLGFPKLEIVVVSASLKAGLKFVNSTDPAMQALALGTGMVNRLKNLAKAVRINWPVVDAKDIDKYKMREKKRELASWASLSTQGKSVKSLADDKIANAWLYKPTLLKPCRFITALKMRTNTTANKVVLHRAKATADTTCRKCKSQPETLAHILGQCHINKAERIRRHDEIKDLVMDEIMKRDSEATVTKEVTIQSPSGGNLKPDLIVRNQKGVFVVDITVRHEDNDYLAQGRNEKSRKYSPLLPLLQREYGATAAEVLPLVVGTRGAMPKETIMDLKKLRIHDRKTYTTISLIALRSSIEIYHRFMDYDGPRSTRNR